MVDEILAPILDAIPLRLQYQNDPRLSALVDALMLHFYETEQEETFSASSTGAELKAVFRTLPATVQLHLLSIYRDIPMVAKAAEEQKSEDEKFRFKARVYGIGALMALFTLCLIMIIVAIRGDSYEAYGQLGEHMRFITELFKGLGGL